MIIHKYLFEINKGKVTVLNYDEYTGKLNYETNKGERTFPIEDNFWEWWIRTVSFTPQQDKVDFCFIYDEPHPIMDYDFECVAESCWRYERFQGHLEQLVDEHQMILKDEDNQPQTAATKVEEEKKFMIVAEDEEIEEFIESEMTPLARLFTGRLQQERKERNL